MLKLLQITYPADKLEVGMTIVTRGVVGTFVITGITEHGPSFMAGGYRFTYDMIDYSLVTVADAVRLEDNPIKQLAYRILAEDPMATDAARDALRC